MALMVDNAALDDHQCDPQYWSEWVTEEAHCEGQKQMNILNYSSEEKNYILENRGGEMADGEMIQRETRKTPFKEMILTPMVWIIMLCEFANIWGILVMINEGPNFIDKILKRSISGVSKII